MKETKSLVCRLLMLCAVMFFALNVSAQTTITGHVKDGTGEVIIGASIVVKGTQGGTVTDFDGNFSLQCKPGATLVVSYIVYRIRSAGGEGQERSRHHPAGGCGTAQ